MKKYTNPAIEMIVLQSADCITLSPVSYEQNKDTKDISFWS